VDEIQPFNVSLLKDFPGLGNEKKIPGLSRTCGNPATIPPSATSSY